MPGSLNALRVCRLRSAKVSQSSAKTVTEQAISVAMFLLIKAMPKEALVTEVVGLGCGVVRLRRTLWPNACAIA